MPNTRKKIPALNAPADGWMSVAKAARAIGVAYNTIYVMALRGELQSQTVADRVFIHADSVKQFLIDREAEKAAS